MFSSHSCPRPPVSLELSSSNDSPTGRRFFRLFSFIAAPPPPNPHPQPDYPLAIKPPGRQAGRLSVQSRISLRQRFIRRWLCCRGLSGTCRATPPRGWLCRGGPHRPARVPPRSARPGAAPPTGARRGGCGRGSGRSSPARWLAAAQGKRGGKLLFGILA